MKFKYMLCILCTAFMLTGCAHTSLLSQGAKEDTWTDSGFVTIGHRLTVHNTDNNMTLLENIDVLSADGLYYATWTMGDSEPYENSEGETVDLYDAHLYLLLGEFPAIQDAQDNMNKWITAGESNYEVLSKEEAVCNGQSYTLITYNCISDDNPYAHGISAFATCQNSAVCIELTCRETFEQDLKTLLIDFLNNCTYSDE